VSRIEETRVGGFRIGQSLLIEKTLRVSNHARKRMQSRGISRDSLLTCLLFGKRVHARGAVIHFLGRRQIQQRIPWTSGAEKLEGLHVVVVDGEVVTVYRNREKMLGRKASRGRGRDRLRPSAVSTDDGDSVEVRQPLTQRCCSRREK